jgi:hypothetical protein
MIGGWVGPRAVLDAVVKRKIPSPHREYLDLTGRKWREVREDCIMRIFINCLIKYLFR